MDGPGGAIFSENQDKESDRSFQAIRDHIQKAQGLMVCVDSTQQLSNASSNQEMHRYYNDNVQYLLTHSYSLELPFQRISFVLTKADLYAQIMGHEQDAEQFLLMVDPLELVFKLIGKDVFRSIIAFSPYKNVVFQFSFSSVYGFTKGALHTKKERLNAEDWMPYNVVENFAFLLTGEKEHPCQHLYSIQDIEKRI